MRRGPADRRTRTTVPEPGSGPDDKRLRRTAGTQFARSDGGNATAGAPLDMDRLEARLVQGVSDLGLAASGEQLQALKRFLELLRRWGGVYNLTALREPGPMVSHHLLDCLALLPALERWSTSWPATESPGGHAGPGCETSRRRTALRILDVGSGGGLPGVVLAIMQPDWSVTCVDAVAKKASFIRQAAAELRLQNLHAVHGRVEDLASKSPGRFDIITSRAFASLPDFCRWTRGLLSPGGAWVAMKGKPPADEIAALGPEVQVFHVEQLSVPGMDAERCLVWLKPH